MVRAQLREDQWTTVETIIASQRSAGRRAKDDRNFIEAVLWWRRTGIPWRDLPEEFGPWKTVFNRFDRWSKTGRWSRLFHALRSDPDDEWHSIDSTINRAHQHAAGGKGGRQPKESVGRAAG
jgi:transposase